MTFRSTTTSLLGKPRVGFFCSCFSFMNLSGASSPSHEELKKKCLIGMDVEKNTVPSASILHKKSSLIHLIRVVVLHVPASSQRRSVRPYLKLQTVKSCLQRSEHSNASIDSAPRMVLSSFALKMMKQMQSMLQGLGFRVQVPLRPTTTPLRI